MSVLGSLGGPLETRIDAIAADWTATAPDFHLLAITCKSRPGTPVLPSGPGLPDDAFTHDGMITKSEVRALTIARLSPQRGELLWDLGCACGSVAIEWMRGARDAEAIGIDHRVDRLEMARENANKLGTPRLKLVEGRMPDALNELPAPDAIFIGGGLTEELAELTFNALRPHGRLVANAVTLESETLLAELDIFTARSVEDVDDIKIGLATVLNQQRSFGEARQIWKDIYERNARSPRVLRGAARCYGGWLEMDDTGNVVEVSGSGDYDDAFTIWSELKRGFDRSAKYERVWWESKLLAIYVKYRLGSSDPQGHRDARTLLNNQRTSTPEYDRETQSVLEEDKRYDDLLRPYFKYLERKVPSF